MLMSEWDWLINVTCNDISVIYETAHICAGRLKKKLDPWSGSQCHIHVRAVGFFNVPVQAPARANLLWLFREIGDNIRKIVTKKGFTVCIMCIR